jgi:hypothetical protein
MDLTVRCRRTRARNIFTVYGELLIGVGQQSEKQKTNLHTRKYFTRYTPRMFFMCAHYLLIIFSKPDAQPDAQPPTILDAQQDAQ